MHELIEVPRPVRLYYRTSELLPPVALDLEPKEINKVRPEVWQACLEHNAKKPQPQLELIERYLQDGTIHWFPADGGGAALAQAKVDGLVPFASPKVAPLQAAAQTYREVKSVKGADGEAEAQDLAIAAAEKALETS